LDQTLQKYLHEITARVIAESINGDNSEVEVRSGNALPGSAPEFAGQANGEE